MRQLEYEETTKEQATHVRIGAKILEYDGTLVANGILAEPLFNAMDILKQAGVGETYKFLRRAAYPLVVLQVSDVDYEWEMSNGAAYKTSQRLVVEYNSIVEAGDFLILLTPPIRECLEKNGLLSEDLVETKKGKNKNK